MIDPRAVDEFLNAKRESLAWIKTISERKLDRELERQGFRVCRPAQPLRKHQKACLLLGMAYPALSFWLDMGTGKTRLILELLHYLWLRGEIKRVIIEVPSEASVNGWVKQIKTWRIPLPYLALGNSPSKAKLEQMDEFEEGLILVTYAGLSRCIGQLKKKKKAKKGRFVRNPKREASLIENLQGIVWDESTEVGNKKSLQFRINRALSKAAPFRYALAGRPFGRDPTPMFAQQWLVDRGETLGPTLGLFRAAFFTEKKGHFGGFEYKYRKEMEPVLAEIMQHRSISYADYECGQLPKVTTIVDRIALPEEAEAYYEKAVAAIRKAKGDTVVIQNMFLRMRQLSSGFIGYRDDESGEKAQLEFPVNPKLDWLLERIREMPLDRKGVIFHEFTYSGHQLDKALTKLKLKHGWLWGGTKNSQAIQDRFDDDPDMRFLIVNHRLGAMSLNLQVANYQFDYENPVSVIKKDQMDKRLFREGQKYPGFRYELVAAPVDERILEFHKEGGSIWSYFRKTFDKG